MRCLFVHFRAIGIGILQHIACKFDYHDLHTETNTESGNIIVATILCSKDFSFNTTLTEARTNDNAVHGRYFFAHIFFGQLLAIDKMRLEFIVIIGSRL